MNSKTTKKRIAWFTPTSNINDFSLSEYSSEQLLPKLSETFDIVVFSDSFKKEYLGLKNFHYLTARRRHEEEKFDLFFYNFEDKPYCNFIRVHLALIPGIIWFHNFVFTTHGPEPILNSNWKNIVQKFKDNTIQWTTRDTVHKNTNKQGLREGAFALKAFFSNQANVYQYRECEIKLSEEEASFLPLPIINKDVVNNKTNDIFTIAISGSADIENRSHKIIKALNNLDFEFKLIWLTEKKDLNKVKLLTKKIKNIEIITDYSLSNWKNILVKADCSIQLLYSAYNQTGPFLLQSLCLGKPTLVTTFGASDLLSDKIVFKIEPGMHEATQIKMVLEALKNNEVSFDSQFVANEGQLICDLGLVAKELTNYLEEFIPKSIIFLDKWDKFKNLAKKDLKNEVYDFHKGSTFELEQRVFSKHLKELN